MSGCSIMGRVVFRALGLGGGGWPCMVNDTDGFAMGLAWGDDTDWFELLWVMNQSRS